MATKTKTTTKKVPAKKAVAKKPTSETTLKASVYTAAGKETRTIDLPGEIFGLSWNGDLVHQVVHAMRANERTQTANTKDRSEVRGGGKKPWKQKGTGRARHGPSRSPIWRGGGITHGPRAERDYSQKINKKMRVTALYTVLSEKMRKGQVLFVDDLGLSGKTKDASKIVSTFATLKGFEKLAGKKSVALVTLPTKDVVTFRSLRNLPQLALEVVKDINPVDLLESRYLILVKPEESIDIIKSRSEKRA